MDRVTKSLVVTAAVAVTVVVVALLAPAAGAARARTESAAYERSSGVHVLDAAWVEVAAGDLPQATPLGREKNVSITITDDSGRPVAAVVHQGDHELGAFCGATEAPLPLASREPVHVHVYSGAGCADVSTPTAGTVEFTFTR